ncbi:hypothetical protein ACW95P_00425 [Candidatus Mycoplasma pogonae]
MTSFFNKKKTHFFIDFECISAPYYNAVYNREKYNLPSHLLPMAYTVGFYNSRKKFVYKTEILLNLEINASYQENLRANLLKSFQKLKPKFNLEKTVFWAFEKGMEEAVLSYAFGNGNVEVEEFNNFIIDTIVEKDISKIGIKELSQNFNNTEYFLKTRQQIIMANENKNVNNCLIPYKTLISKEGVFANYLCFWIYLSRDKNLQFKKNRFSKEFVPLNLTDVVEELTLYSQDDVLRMDYITQNIEKIRKIYSIIYQLRKKYYEIEIKFKFYTHLHRDINTFIQNVKSEFLKTPEQQGILANAKNLATFLEEKFLSQKKDLKQKESEIASDQIKKII